MTVFHRATPEKLAVTIGSRWLDPKDSFQNTGIKSLILINYEMNSSVFEAETKNSWTKDAPAGKILGGPSAILLPCNG